MSRFLLILLVFTFINDGVSCDGPSSADSQAGFYDRGFSGSGITGKITDTIVDNRTGLVYVGGSFSSVDGVEAHNIAVFDSTTRTWVSLAGDGLRAPDAESTPINALAISGKYLYVGGSFDATYDGVTTGLNSIARYDMDLQVWAPLAGNGLNAPVHAIAIDGSTAYVGGEFIQTADTLTSNLGHIAKYDTNTATWSPLAHNGLDYTVRAIAVDYPEIYVGGAFSGTMDGSVGNLSAIAKYSVLSNAWTSFQNNGLNGEVFAIAVEDNIPYVGGTFLSSADGIKDLRYIAFYDEANAGWTELSEGGLDGPVHDIVFSGINLVIGGAFSQTWDTPRIDLWHVAYYDRTRHLWSAFQNGGLDATVRTFSKSDTELIIGGDFVQTIDGLFNNLNGLAQLTQIDGALAGKGQNRPNTAPWTPMGSGQGAGLSGDVKAIANGLPGEIYVGGDFLQTAGGTPVSLKRIGRLDPYTRTWTALANNGLDGSVNALAGSGSTMFVGGAFANTSDGNVIDLNRIAKYNINTNTWTPLAHGGLDGTVRALIVIGGDLYVGGDFTATSDGLVTGLNHIARYNIGADTWSALPEGGLDGVVRAFAVSGLTLYAGGSFTQTTTAATTSLNKIARFDTSNSTWSGVANSGLNGDVKRLTMDNTLLSTGGTFTATADTTVPLDRLAVYDTANNVWSPVTGDADGRSAAIATNVAVHFGNELYVGGAYDGVGGVTAKNFTRVYLERWLVTAGNSDWFNDANWSTGTAPAADSNAAIPAGVGNIDITSADVTMHDLMVNGGTLTVAPGRTLTISGVLGLNGGIITGGGTVVVTNCKSSAILGGGPTAYIRTALVRCANETGVFNYPVGTANGYSPVSANVTAIGIPSSSLSITAVQGSHPLMDGGQSAGRYWNITETGDITTDLTFDYLDGDVAGTEAGYKLYKFEGGPGSLVASTLNTISDRVSTLGISSFSSWAIGNLAATAAGAFVSGRAVNADGQGINKTVIRLADQAGNTRSVLTNAFGYYRFDDVTIGHTYVLAAENKRFRFSPASRIISVEADAVGLDFVVSASELKRTQR